MDAVILSERTLADTDGLFASAVAHVARKLGRVKPLDADTLPQGRAETVAALDAWAGSEVDTWRRELARYYEDHIPVHLRPDPALNAALRRMAAGGVTLACYSPGPAEAVGIVLHRLGVSRLVAHTDVGGAAAAVALADVLAPSRASALVVADDTAHLEVAAAAGTATAAALWTGRLAAAPAPAHAVGSADELAALALEHPAVAG